MKTQDIVTDKLPQAFVSIDALPMTSTGKIRKHELVAAIAAGSLVPERSL